MSQQYHLTIADQRDATPRLRWLTLIAPDLARRVRAGQYLLVRCADVGSYDPLLRRALFVAASEPALGQVGLLYEPLDRGLVWLSRGRSGDVLDVIGPFGRPFTIASRTRTLLLAGQGPGLAALLLLAQESVRRGCAVTLFAAAADDARLPPPFLLPREVEYEGVVGQAVDAVTASVASGQPVSAVLWADQVCAALPRDQLAVLRDMIQHVKYRWTRGFASALLEGPLVCGVGACGVCMVDLRRGARLLCSDGPVIDLVDL